MRGTQKMNCYKVNKIGNTLSVIFMLVSFLLVGAVVAEYFWVIVGSAATIFILWIAIAIFGTEQVSCSTSFEDMFGDKSKKA